MQTHFLRFLGCRVGSPRRSEIGLHVDPFSIHSENQYKHAHVVHKHACDGLHVMYVRTARTIAPSSLNKKIALPLQGASSFLILYAASDSRVCILLFGMFR